MILIFIECKLGKIALTRYSHKNLEAFTSEFENCILFINGYHWLHLTGYNSKICRISIYLYLFATGYI